MKRKLLPALLFLLCNVLMAQEKSTQSKFRIAASGGVAYRISKSPGNYSGTVNQYVKEIRFGPEFNADATYFFNEYYGAGLKYSLFSTSSSFSDGAYVISNIKISYLGPTFYRKVRLNSPRNKMFYGVSIGYMGYKDDGWINSEKTMMKGSTIGGLVELCYDYKIVGGLHMGINGGLSGGGISNMKLNGTSINSDQKEGLTRLSASIGLRYIR